MGGFESASHINESGVRLDMLAATQHDRYVISDYHRLRSVGIETVREAVRWHRVEVRPGAYDFSSVTPYLAAANELELEIIWDLFHYGYPDDIDIYSDRFVQRFAAFAAATAAHLRQGTQGRRFYTPLNEISFFAWAAGQVGWFHPFSTGRGGEVKRQLVRAWFAAVDAIRAEDAEARFVSVEPLIHTVPPRGRRDRDGRAARQNASQWETWEMITGRAQPELGGAEHYLDIIGVNFYPINQWLHHGRPVFPGDPLYKPFSDILAKIHQRYNRPVFVAETGEPYVGEP